MKSLADLKRALTLNAKYDIEYFDPTGKHSKQERTVVIVQTNRVAARRPDCVSLTWLDFTPRSEWSFDGDTAIWTDPNDSHYGFTLTLKKGS